MKLRHLWKIALTYIAYESNIATITTYLNYLPLVIAFTTFGFFL